MQPDKKIRSRRLRNRWDIIPASRKKRQEIRQYNRGIQIGTNFMMRFRRGTILALACLLAGPAMAEKADWPQRPVRMVVAAPAGSSVDIVARLIADGLKDRLGQPVIVDNKPAAAGTAGATEVATAAADGYTLFLGYNGPLATAPALFARLAYDPQAAFAPIILTGLQPNLLAVNPSVTANNLRELIALAKSLPGTLNYASVGNGSSSHLSMEFLKTRAGIDLVHVPFNGGPPATQAVVAGDVQLVFAAPSNLAGQIKSGKLRAIAVTSLKRFAPLPDIPTVAESGVRELAGFEAIAWNGLVAPTGTPPAVIARLNREINAILATPAVRGKLFDAGIEPGGGSAEAFAQWMRAEARKWGELVRATGARID
jgi:tripartite-type tricarboxylate transporter receptor subunit TctC